MRISEYFKAHRDTFKALCAGKLDTYAMEAMLNDMDKHGVQYGGDENCALARFWGMVCDRHRGA